MKIRYTFFLCAVLGAAVFCSSALAQRVSKPMNITNIPGGFFIEWASPVELAAVQLDRRLAGPLEVMFDVPSATFAIEMDRNPQPGVNPEIVTALADYWIVRGKPERAIPLYEDSLKRGDLDETRSFVFQNNLAMLYSQVLGQHAKALEIVDDALTTKRDNVTLLDTKGLIHLNAGDPSQAIPHLQRAVELSCQHPIYCMHLAYAMFREGRTSQARDNFDKALEHLLPLVPNMTKENKAMFDTLQMNLVPVTN